MPEKTSITPLKVTIDKVFFSKNDFIIAITTSKITVQGNIHHKAHEIEGESLELLGRYEEHKTHGKSFHFTNYSIMGDYDLFFLTKIVSGISKSAATEILSKCGNRLEEIIEKYPSVLLEVKGIGKKKLESIVRTFKENKPLQSLSALLLPYGITVHKVKQIHEFYLNKDADAVVEIKKNPYILTRMDGVGFKRADEIALKMGQEVDSAFRVQHGIQYAIEKHCSENGHTYVRSSALYELTRESLDILQVENSAHDYEKLGFALSDERCRLEMDIMKDEKKIQNVDETGDKISLPRLLHAEKYILSTLKKYANIVGEEIVPDIDGFIKHAEEASGFTFGLKQKEALRLGNMAYPIFFIYGLAGSGKTTTATTLLNLLSLRFGKSSIVCTSLSGVAAARASAVTSYKGYTIHSLLSFKGKEGFEYNERNKLPYSVILLDEASMVDAWIFSSLLKAIDFERTILCMIGDPSQLPSVGSGDVYRDIINKSENSPYLCHGVGLDEVFRQSKEQVINIFATDYVRNGLVPENYKDTSFEDFSFVPVEIANSWAIKKRSSDKEWREIKFNNNNRIAETVCNIALGYRDMQSFYKTDIKKYISYFQVITPMKKHELGVASMNKRIQDILNPTEYKDTLYLEGKKIKKRDKVIHLKNIDKKTCDTSSWASNRNNLKAFVQSGMMKERRIYNGMIGVVIDIDLQSDIVSVFYPNEAIVTFYKRDDFEKQMIDHGYCTTVHKSQGSEYSNVVAIYTTSHMMMHSNQLTYTTMTRAKDKFFAVGESYAFEKGCKEVKNAQRDTFLSLL